MGVRSELAVHARILTSFGTGSFSSCKRDGSETGNKDGTGRHICARDSAKIIAQQTKYRRDGWMVCRSNFRGYALDLNAQNSASTFPAVSGNDIVSRSAVSQKRQNVARSCPTAGERTLRYEINHGAVVWEGDRRNAHLGFKCRFSIKIWKRLQLRDIIFYFSLKVCIYLLSPLESSK